MDPVVKLSDGLTRFVLADGRSFSLDLIEVCMAVRRAVKESEAAGETNFEYVDRFRDWMREQSGGQIDLSRAQADELMDYAGIEFDRQKKARAAAPTPNSATPTASAS